MERPGQTGYARSAVLAMLLSIAVLLGTGCVVLPIPTNRLGDHSRRDIGPEAMNELVAGQTTREEVLLRLGEPDEWRDNASQYRYHWERVKWDIIWVVGGYNSAAAGDIPVNKNYNLILSFDAAGVVTNRECNEKYQPSELEKAPPILH